MGRPLSSSRRSKSRSVCVTPSGSGTAWQGTPNRSSRTLPAVRPSCHAAPNSTVARAASHAADRIQRSAARRNPLILGPGRAVHRVGVIGQQDGLQAEVAKDRLQRRRSAGEPIGAITLMASWRGPSLASASTSAHHGGVIAFLVAARVARRRDVNHLGKNRTALGDDLAEIHRNVVADGLGQTGRGDADQAGCVLADHVFQADAQVFAAAEDGRFFAEVRGGDIQRLAEMADHVAADVGGAALRAVQQRHGPLHAAEG